MTTNYIEIDSTYRNRNQYPKPSEFDIIISQSGLKGKQDALDPVSESAPILNFNTSMIYNVKSNQISNLTVVSPNPSLGVNTSPTDPSILLIKTTDYLRPEVDFYVGSVLVLDNGGVNEYRRIIAYQFVNADTNSPTYYYGLFTVNIPYPTTLGSSGYIINPTPLPTSIVGSTLFWIPSASFVSNFYINYYIHNLNSNDFKKIIAYDGETRLATLDSPTVIDWSTSLNFSIRKELPSVIGFTNALTANTEITSISSSSLLYGELSNKPNAYAGDYIRFRSAANAEPSGIGYSPFGQQRKITAFDPSTNTIRFSPPVFISTDALFYSISNTIIYEIEPFSRDNFSPFNYMGSMVSSQQQVCYEVELVNLAIPNLVLKSSRGGRIAFYPYVYVEFHPISDSSTGSKGTLYSNNPNSYKMLFRAIVSDTQQPIITPFIKIGGDGQVHTIKFKPNDSFHFAVYNSDGELLEFSQQDNYSPTAPNPVVQISALFSMRRVS